MPKPTSPAPWTVFTAPAGAGKTNRLTRLAAQQPRRQATLLIMNADDIGNPETPWFDPQLSQLVCSALNGLPSHKSGGLTMLRLQSEPWYSPQNVELLREAFKLGFKHYLIDVSGTALIRDTPSLLEAATHANAVGATLHFTDNAFADQLWRRIQSNPEHRHLSIF